MGMKRLIAISSLVAVAFGAQAAVTIGGNEYRADTLEHRQVGPGIFHTMMRLPDYPLNVYLLEADMDNPYNGVETTVAYNQVGLTEALTNACLRNRTATRRPVAGCNANFWCVSGNGEPWNRFCLGTPYGAVVRRDTIYVNTGNSIDPWDGGPTRTGGCAIAADKTLYMGHFTCGGTITGNRLGKTVAFETVNRRNKGGSIALWTPGYGRDREFETNWTGHNTQGEALADNYYLTFMPGSTWGVNKDMRFKVAKIVKGEDRRNLGEYDACFTATGNQKGVLASLQEGDEIVVNHGWKYNEGTPFAPAITDMIEGNAPVMHNGELTGRNYDEDYNSMVYSRTGYGTDATGRKLYMIVIDKSSSRAYGTSAGCSTEVMCQILKSVFPDISEVISLDAGGSAEMLVLGNIVNTTTEGTPRDVANGWLVSTVAPEDHTIASIQFYDYRAELPLYSSYTPRIVGFNQWGEIVDDDVKGFTLSCEPTLGTTEGSTLIVGGALTSQMLTATLDGMTAQVEVRTLEAAPAIVTKPVAVIGRYPLPLEVSAAVGNEIYTYDPSKLAWRLGDEGMATIADGRLSGVVNGTTPLYCMIGGFEDETVLRVEISDTEERDAALTTWTLKGAGAKDFMWGDDGVLSFAYSSNRAPYIQLTTDDSLYGNPDEVALAFTSTVPIEKVQIDTRNYHVTKLTYQEFNGPFEAEVEHVLHLDMDALGGVECLSTYPLAMKTIKFTPAKSNYGDNAIALRLTAHYRDVECLVPGDVNGDDVVSGADVTALYNVLLDGAATAGNADVNGDGIVSGADVTALYNLLLN